ncbi:hypothetical protein BS78_01G332700 [Paspalum vaginatum]|nr:hypothetical protein BS78_01G332700 [Paspalum vaginatum]
MAGKPPPAAAAGKPGGGGAPRPVLPSRAEVVRRWEELIDDDNEMAGELFDAALLRDARAEYARKEVDEEEERRRARVFEPWQPPAEPAAGSPLPPPVVVMGLRAPSPAASAPGRPPKPRPPSSPDSRAS